MKSRQPECVAFSASAAEFIKESSAETIIIVARWSSYPAHRSGYEEGSGKGDEEAFKGLSESLLATVSQLKTMDKEVIVMAELPNIGEKRPSVPARAMHFGRQFDGDTPLSDHLNRQGSLMPVNGGVKSGHWAAQ